MKKFLSLLLVFILTLTAFSAFAFSDVTSHHWAKQYIDDLAEFGIVGGYEDGSFRPDGNVTRAEFAKMICVAFALDGESDGYADTIGHWAEDYICRTDSVVYTDGTDYAPDTNATRAQIAYALAGVLGLAAVDSDMQNRFSDWDTVDEAMAKAVAAAVENSIIEGYDDGTIKGNGDVTRAEACALICRALAFGKSEEEIPPQDEPPAEDNTFPEQQEPTVPDSGADSSDPLYTANPLKDLYVVTSLTSVMDGEGADVDYKLTYLKAGEEQVYTTVLDGDSNTGVYGTKSSLASLCGGDVFVFDTGFHGHIDTIWVVASLKDREPVDEYGFNIPESMKRGSGAEYEFAAGRVVSRNAKSKSVVIGVEYGGTSFNVTVPKTATVTSYIPTKTSAPWIDDSISAIEEGVFVLVRYTDSRVTEAIVVDYNR